MNARVILLMSVGLWACASGSSPDAPVDDASADVGVDAGGGGDAGPGDPSDASRDGPPDSGADGALDGDAAEDAALDAEPPPLAECSGGSASGEVPFADHEAGAFTDPADCDGCPGELSFAVLEARPGGTTATVRFVVATGAPATSCRLVVVAACGASTFEVPLSEFGPAERTIPLFCGDNTLIASCDSEAGTSVLVSEPIGAPPCAADTMRATLTWDECGSDHELHVIQNGQFLYDPLFDCTWNACTGGSLDWGPPGPEGNVTKDVDDTSFEGIENAVVTDAAAGIYHIMVEMWGSLASGCATTESNLRVFVDESPVANLTQPLARHEVWYVGTVEFPSGEFTAATDLSASTTTAVVTPCDASWGATASGITGCQLELPDPL